MKRLKTILLGPTGSGKSSTGNSLLYTNPQFRVNIGFSAVTQSFDQAMGIVRGHTLEVINLYLHVRHIDRPRYYDQN